MTGIRIEEQKQNYISSRLSNLLVSCFFSAAVFFMLFSVTDWWGVIAISTVLIILISFIFQYTYKKKDRKAWIFGTTVISLVLVLAYRYRIVNGFIHYINSIIENWNLKHGSIYKLFVVGGLSETMDKVLFALVIMVLITVFINVFIRLDLVVYAVLLEYLSFILYMLVVENPNKYAIFLVMIITLIILSIGSPDKKSIKDSWVFWLIMTCAVCIVAAGSYLMIRRIPGDRLDSYRTKGIRYIENRIFGKTDLPEGDLSKVSEIDTSNSPRLEVEAETEGLVYLRGFTGCTYEDNSWQELEKEAYQDENKDMLQYMNDTKESSLTMLSGFMNFSNQFSEGTFYYKPETIKVKNIGASDKYIYTPYTCAYLDFGYYNNIYKDLSVQNSFTDIKKEYEFDAADVDANELISLYDNGFFSTISEKQQLGISDGQTKFFNLEQAYRNYADQHYMTISDEDRYRFDASLEHIPTEVGVESITAYIRESIKERSDLSNSMEYSTEAVLMFRYYGVPARYVEGYRCELKEGKNVITSGSAHAWVDVYRYGIGWIPVEVTPGFYEDVTSPETSLVQEISPESPKPETSPEPNKDTENSSKKGKKNNALFLILLLLATIFVIIAVIVLRSILINKKIREQIENEDRNHATLYMAGRLWYILGKFGVSVNEGMPSRSKDEIDASFREAAVYDFKSVDDILLKARYSGRDINEEDYSLVKSYYESVKAKATSELSLMKKLLWRFVYVIY